MILTKPVNTSIMLWKAIENFLGPDKVRSHPQTHPFCWVPWTNQMIINFEKWPIAHFWSSKILSTRRETAPFVSASRYDRGGPCKHKQLVTSSCRKFSRAHWSHTIILLRPLFWGLQSKLTVVMTMDFEKSPVAHVWDHRIRSICRKTTPFVSADRYDPKGPCKNK